MKTPAKYVTGTAALPFNPATFGEVIVWFYFLRCMYHYLFRGQHKKLTGTISHPTFCSSSKQMLGLILRTLSLNGSLSKIFMWGLGGMFMRGLQHL